MSFAATPGRPIAHRSRLPGFGLTGPSSRPRAGTLTKPEGNLRPVLGRRQATCLTCRSAPAGLSGEPPDVIGVNGGKEHPHEERRRARDSVARLRPAPRTPADLEHRGSGRGGCRRARVRVRVRQPRSPSERAWGQPGHQQPRRRQPGRRPKPAGWRAASAAAGNPPSCPGSRPGRVGWLMITAPAACDRFAVFGTSAVLLVTTDSVLRDARSLVDGELGAVDLACNRFRPDSEISILNGSRGAEAKVSGLFAEAIEAGLRAARLTAGDVDPTCGAALASLGYDRDFALITKSCLVTGPPAPAAGWQRIGWDRSRAAVRLPRGVQLDLGATAKAWAADRCARLASRHLD